MTTMGFYTSNNFYQPSREELQAMFWCNDRNITAEPFPLKGATYVLVNNNGILKSGKKVWKYHKQREAVYTTYLTIYLNNVR